MDTRQHIQFNRQLSLLPRLRPERKSREQAEAGKTEKNKTQHFQQKVLTMTKKRSWREDTCTWSFCGTAQQKLCFKVWQKDIPNDRKVCAHYPFDRHGLAGRVSNHDKVHTKEKFLDVVDNNSQPNGRQPDSRNPTHHSSPNFITITMPKQGVHNYYECRLASSLVGEFNLIQEDIGQSTISNYSASTQLNTERPIYPYKVYVDLIPCYDEK